jgi:hypothetical protein
MSLRKVIEMPRQENCALLNDYYCTWEEQMENCPLKLAESDGDE